jgi:predicted AlkP superfamily phosphohydrolase/phosphomutase
VISGCADRASRRAVLLLAIAAGLLLAPLPAQAYVGPGAGVAFLTTGLILLWSLILALFGLLLWPFRQIYLRVTRRRPPQPARIDRAVVIGLDGLDPDLVARFMSEGKLPNLAALADLGTISKLSTTFPAMSPVAWSSFATGVDPAKHGIFDFLTRERSTYLPTLSSAQIGNASHHLRLGRYRIPLGAPRSRLLRRSKTFWRILGEHRVPTSILRVPITFPPEKFDGTLLSAMCVPDLEGTQGSFSYFSNGPTGGEQRSVGGRRVGLIESEGKLHGALAGPDNPIHADRGRLSLPFTLTVEGGASGVRLEIGDQRLRLEPGCFSDWVTVAFPMGLGLKLRGICRFRLLEARPFVRLYVSPINIDPARPVMPISHPFIFSVFLAKLNGPYSTLGLAEDTWALNEGVLDEAAFLEQAWANHEEREAMLLAMLDRTPRGLVSCVFDGSDRIQHMFMRYLDEGHPAARGDPQAHRYRTVIEDTYVRLDQMVGRLMARVNAADPRTLFMVLSDHGFKTFRHGVNLNSWLHQHGYLALRPGRTESGEWLEGVDWSRTRAFALGLAGIFLNVKGRESQGVVGPGPEARTLTDELVERLRSLTDPGTGEVAIREAFPAHQLYRGPYADEAPDLIAGYAPGWRASWNGVRGIVDEVVFDENTRAWSGDHCIDPREVPGVLIANHRLARLDESQPAIADIAPTLLQLFGIPAPAHMDGRSLVQS